MPQTREGLGSPDREKGPDSWSQRRSWGCCRTLDGGHLTHWEHIEHRCQSQSTAPCFAEEAAAQKEDVTLAGVLGQEA